MSMRTSLGTRLKASSILFTGVVLFFLPSCRSAGPSAPDSVSLVRHRRAVLGCDWIASIDSESSAATESGIRVLKLKAARLGANAVYLSGVMSGDTQSAWAYRCATRPPEEPAD
jgi:hypothetical protein